MDYKDCIFIGDSLEYDIIGSKNVGMNPIWLNHSKKENSFEPEVKSYNCVKDLINRLNEIEKDV